jgi:DNA polymerase-1
MVNSKDIFVIDATFLIDASHKAFLGAPLLLVDGKDQTFLFGMVRDFLRLRWSLGIHRGAVVIGKDGYRVTMTSKIQEFVSFLENFGIPVIHEPEHSVLDVCASLAPHTTRFVTQNRSILFLGTDTRAVILLREGKEPEILTSPAVFSKLGIRTKAIPSFLALTEGPKSTVLTKRQAIALLEKKEDLAQILEDISVVSARQIKKKLMENKAVLLERLKRLSVSNCLPFCDMRPESMEINIDNDRCAQLLHVRRFHSLVRLLRRPPKVEILSTPSKHDTKGYHAVQTTEALERLVERIEASEYCAVDTEASDKDPHTADLYGVSFSVKKGEAFYLPMIDFHLKELDTDTVLSALKIMLEGKTKFVGHNIKYDYLLLRRYGIKVNNYHFDTMLAAKDCFGDWDLLNLPYVAEKILGKKIKAYKEIVGKTQNFLDLPFRELLTHACADADTTLQIYPMLEKEIKQRELYDHYRNETMALALRLGEWEYDGIPVNSTKLSKTREALLKEVAALKKSVLDEAGVSFNIDSEKELHAVICKTPGLTEVIGGRKLTLRLLEELAISQTLVRKVVEYRRRQKQLRHVEEVIKAVRDGRLYPIFSQTRSHYGSLYSTKPRLFEEWVHPLVLSCIKHPLARHFRSPCRSLDNIERLAQDDVLRRDRACGEGVPSSFLKLRALPGGLDHQELLLSIMVGLPKEKICRAFCLSQAKVASLCHDLEVRYSRSFSWLVNYRKAVAEQGMAVVDERTHWFNGVRSSNLQKREKAIQSSVRWLLRY